MIGGSKHAGPAFGDQLQITEFGLKSLQNGLTMAQLAD